MTDTARDDDQAAIARLMTGWIHRDLGNWDELAALFHRGATIDISWIDGLATDFVEGSKKMSAGPTRTKHLITQPVVRFADDRAFVETNAVIFFEDPTMKIGVEQHNRFLDRVSTVDGVWRINHRDSVYDLGTFTYPWGVNLADPIDLELLEAQPREYAPMAYLNARAGHPFQRICATRGSELEAGIRRRGEEWLAGA